MSRLTQHQQSSEPIGLYARLGGQLVGEVGALRTAAAAAHQDDVNERYRLAALANDDIVWDLDLIRNCVVWSEAMERCFGLAPTPAESTAGWWKWRIHPDDRATVADMIASSLAGSSDRHSAEYRFRRGDGSYAYVLDRCALVRDGSGKAVRAVGVMIDLTDRKRALQALRLSEERFRLAAAVSGLGIADIDLVERQEHWSLELRNILGIAPAAAASFATKLRLLHPEDLPKAIERYRRTLAGEGQSEETLYRINRADDGDLRWIAAQAHLVHDEEGADARVIVTVRDVTEQKTGQDRIYWAATHDAVTTLPNRSLFKTRLDAAIDHAERTDAPFSLLLIDLDNFKYINDVFGHQVGDQTLAAFAHVLVGVVPLSTTVARLGGDEFAVILPGTDSPAAHRLAGAILERLQAPLALPGSNIDLRASIGLSTFPDQGADASTLVQSADLALYSAKTAGRAVVRAFEPTMRADRQREASMLNQARTILAKGWVEPFYQPKIALATGRVAEFEALLRWRHPRTGLQTPATIAHAFGDTELAPLLADAVAEAVVADIRGWIDRGVAFGKISINASAAEFRRPGYGDRLLARFDRHAVPANLIEIEVTETALLDDRDGHVLRALQTLRAAGVTVALDDFGTGFSSLSHLRHFPVDVIKIDRSFIAGIENNAGDRAIIAAVLRLGEALGMTTVAEGIETQAQADFVRAAGCTLGQGYLFSAAISAVEVERYVAARTGVAIGTQNEAEPRARA